MVHLLFAVEGFLVVHWLGSTVVAIPNGANGGTSFFKRSAIYQI